MRKNGLQRPWNRYQYLSVLMYISVNLAFIFEVFNYLGWLKTSLTVIFYVLDFSSIVFYVITTCINPSEVNKANDSSNICSVCLLNRSFLTKHCLKCNRCTFGFDHHCKWVNNCIGTYNYKAFIFLITVSNIFCFYCAGCGGYVLYTFTLESQKHTSDIIITSLFILTSFIVGIILLHLCFFHAYLKCLSMSTYQYIVSKRRSPQVGYRSSENNVRECQNNMTANNDITKISITLT
jgi:predicted membrane protein